MAISLEKRSEAAVVSLTKVLTKAAEKGQDLGNLTAQMILVIDYSGSMEDAWSPNGNKFYSDGTVQDLAERILALSLSGLDDDGDIQVFPFHSDALEPFVLDKDNYVGAIENWRWEGNPPSPAPTPAPAPEVKKGFFGRKQAPAAPARTPERQPRGMGGTNYLSVINAVVRYAEENGMLDEDEPPILVVFQTDGGSSNTDAVKSRLKELANRPIFWQFIGLGRDTSFLTTLDKMPGRIVDNVGKVGLKSLLGKTDEEFYDLITAEPFGQWLPAARARGIVKV